MIKDGETEIHLNFVRTKQLLANEYLPVWIAKGEKQTSCKNTYGTVQHELQKNFMRDNIGTFILYHDVEKSSAVVYYKNTKTLHGMIDTRYNISKMPIDECNHGHHVGGQYVQRHEKNMNVHDYFKPLDLSVRRDKSTSNCRETADQYGTSAKRQRLADEKPVIIFYPEILIFVPHDLIEDIQKSHPDNALVTIVRDFIEYFNGVDMLLAKLSTDDIKIHLNIAGIVFEDKSNVFGFMKPIHVPFRRNPSQKIRYLDACSTSNSISDYLKANRDTFPQDSFDFYFIFSNIDVWSTLTKVVVEGISTPNNIYSMRSTTSNEPISGLIVDYHGNPSGHIVAAHEIGHLFDIDHESQNKGYYEGGKQCYAIMQTIGTFCPDCLKWTNQNIEDLQEFAREDKNRCFLLNKPRSLHPHGYPMRTLSRLQQCHCYGYEHWPVTNVRTFDTILNHTAEKEILNCMIKDGKINIHLKFVKTKQLLANEYLPIWTAKAEEEASWRQDPGIAHHFMTDNIGTFILYHDVEKSSAVVYYKNTKTLNGMIDTRYKISKMPINECNHGHHIGGQYVQRHEENMNVHNYLKQLDPSVRRNKPTLECPKYANNLHEFHEGRQHLHKTSDRKPETIFYPEILIFVPYDLIEYIRNSHPNNALVTIVKNFIEYFNGVDMLLAKLSTDDIKIHLNIAGIVFEERSDVFGFMKSTYVPSDIHPTKKIQYINVKRTTELASVYLKRNINPFPKDSFDFYFIPSRADLWSPSGNIESAGYAKVAHMFTARQILSHKYLPGIIVKYGHSTGYVVAAHEIGHLMFFNHESRLKGHYNRDGQCYAIMKEGGAYCPDCLKWTNQNIEELQKFARENLNRCFLLNKPRSLHPHGYPMRTLSRLQQCHCYGYEHWPGTNPRKYTDEVPHTDCDQNLICGQNYEEVYNILPLDGTPCTNNKVCWNEACRDIPYGPGTSRKFQ
ncbi:hypothetical protein PV325_003697 [Microctonus aethiopoides]|nr:hypothetical protein PV325_003697 [Microctonus aethiopoides]